MRQSRAHRRTRSEPVESEMESVCSDLGSDCDVLSCSQRHKQKVDELNDLLNPLLALGVKFQVFVVVIICMYNWKSEFFF